MTATEFLDKLNRARDILVNTREQEALIIAFDLLALIKSRIQSTGKDYAGMAFIPYTPFTVKQRQKAGYQTGYVDFTQTGRMWANVHPVVKSHTEESTLVVIRGRDKDTIRKLSNQYNKRGNILTPSRGEQILVQQANKERILKALAGIF